MECVMHDRLVRDVPNGPDHEKNRNFLGEDGTSGMRACILAMYRAPTSAGVCAASLGSPLSMLNSSGSNGANAVSSPVTSPTSANCSTKNLETDHSNGIHK